MIILLLSTSIHLKREVFSALKYYCDFGSLVPDQIVLAILNSAKLSRLIEPIRKHVVEILTNILSCFPEMSADTVPFGGCNLIYVCVGFPLPGQN